jgi:hypothetical protein
MSIESGRRMKADCGTKYYESDGGPDCAMCHSTDCVESPEYEKPESEEENELE